jgi:hypothetical protein
MLATAINMAKQLISFDKSEVNDGDGDSDAAVGEI